MEADYRKVTPEEEEILAKRVTNLERKTFSGGVVGALTFIDQLRSRGDQPGEDFADILQPLADAYRELYKEMNEMKVEWQLRVPEDRHSDEGWMPSTEMGAAFFSGAGAEVRTRSVTEWKNRDGK
jgi:hypothetical protein